MPKPFPNPSRQALVRAAEVFLEVKYEFLDPRLPLRVVVVVRAARAGCDA